MNFNEATLSHPSPHSVQGATAQGFSPALAVTADSLFDLILKFNLFPALYVHPSWVQSLFFLQHADTPDQELNPYWIRYLSKTLLDMFKLDQHWEFDFSNPAKKLALIDAEHLMRLGHCVAAILVQPYLRKIISGSKISIINQVIGAEHREFALRWKPTRHNSFSLDVASLNGLTEMAYNALAAQQEWQRFVVRLIISLMPLDATGVRNRLLFKFPMDYRDTDYLKLTEDKRALVAALFFDVLQQQLPDWQKRLELVSLGEQKCNG